MTEHEASDHHDGRRTFFKACIGGMTVGSLGAVAYPVVSFLGFPQRMATDRPLELPLDPPGQMRYAVHRGQQLIVLAREEGPLVVDAACTHLGCNVIWDTADGVFRCPCHGAVFDSEGEVVSGPVNAPLRTVPFTIEDGKIIVG